MSTVLYVADRESSAFQANRMAIDVVCAGDSITGWNNFGAVRDWPYRTYPEFLQPLCEPSLFTSSGLRVANGGTAGEISRNGIGQVRDYLALFPNARYVIVGYGTNDLGMWPDVEKTSLEIIENLGRMIHAIQQAGNKPILLNVPYANESVFPRSVGDELHRKRDYHNHGLETFCRQNHVDLVDIASRLRDHHFADELHPNEAGAQIIAEAVFQELAKMQEE